MFRNSTFNRLAILTLFVASSANAANVKSEDYKCYVEYVGGGDGINFVRSDSADLLILSSLLKKHAINRIGHAKKVWVLNVHECVSEKGMFTLGRAQVLDQKTPR